MADGPQDQASLPASGLTEAKADPDLGLFTRLKGYVRDSLEQHSDFYKEAEECFGFVAGRSVSGKGQWPGNSWQEMIDSGRQPVEFNRVGPIVDSICGMQINNRQEVKYLPRTQGDAEVNERLSSLGDWAREEANAEDEESEMFRNAVICGRGATETRIDFSEEPTGKIVIDNLDVLECGVDPNARKAALSDRRYSWRFRDVPTDEARSMFDGVDATALNATWASTIDTKDGGQGNKTDYPDETREGLNRGDKPKTVRVVQIEWWEQACSYLVAVPGMEGEPQELSEDGYNLLMEQAKDLPDEQKPQGQRLDKRRYRKAFLGKSGILDVTDIDGFQINWTTGRYDRNSGYHYGWVRPMRDPQMLSNKTLSQVLHILNTNAKGGLLIEQGAFRSPKDAEKDWSNPAKSIVLAEGGIAKIKDRTPPPLPQSLVMLQEFSLTAIRDVTGTNVEMLGMADRNQPASLEYQRRQSAMTILASLFNGLRHYYKLQGKTLLNQLKLLPPGVLVRVLIDPQQAMSEFAQAMMEWQQAARQAQAQGQQPPPQPEPPTAQFMSQTKRGEQFDPAKFGLGSDTRFDVIIDEAPSSPNQKDATWSALQPFMDKLPPQAMPIVLENSPLPESVAKELGDILAKAGGPPEIPPQLQAMIEEGKKQIATLTAENAQLKDKSQVDAAEVGVKQADAATRRMKVIADSAQPSEIDELKGQVATIAQAVHGLIQMSGMGG